jgi:histidine triad (HIT) family protein
MRGEEYTMEYDKNNVFARILRKELPVQLLYEDEYASAFPDINPKAPIHVLVIPKGEFISFLDFSEKASPELMVGFNKAVHNVIKLLKLQKNGFRILSNHGLHAGQEIPHYHIHIFGGHPLGPMLSQKP